MDQNIVLNIHDLFTGLLYLLGTVILILLVIGLIKVIGILSNVNGMLKDNRENIDRILDTLPETVENINDTVEQTKKTINKASSAVGIFSEGLEDTVTEVNYGYATLIDVVKAVGDVVRLVTNIFSK